MYCVCIFLSSLNRTTDAITPVYILSIDVNRRRKCATNEIGINCLCKNLLRQGRFMRIPDTLARDIYSFLSWMNKIERQTKRQAMTNNIVCQPSIIIYNVLGPRHNIRRTTENDRLPGSRFDKGERRQMSFVFSVVRQRRRRRLRESHCTLSGVGAIEKFSVRTILCTLANGYVC